MRNNPDQLERPREAAAKTLPGGAGVLAEDAGGRCWTDWIMVLLLSSKQIATVQDAH
jgi:hypothetical protein